MLPRTHTTQPFPSLGPPIPANTAQTTYTLPPPVVVTGGNGPSFAIGALTTFFLFSRASEFIDTTGRLHMVTLMVVAGMFALLSAGTLVKTVASPPGIWLCFFTAWLTLALPFSSWRAQSFSQFSGMWLKSVVFFFLVGGLIFSVAQFRKTIFWLAMATICVMYYSWRTGAKSEDNRFSVTYGTLGNANDLAGSLLMGVPFLLYVATDKRRNPLIRAGCAIFTLALLLMVARTGSRGGLLAAGCMALLVFLKVSMANKVKIFVLCGLLAASFPFVVSKSLIARYATMLSSQAAAGSSMDVASAVESTNARRGLMRQGVLLTLKHPLFGVGMGQFSTMSAILSISRGEPPMWFTCHDVFLLVSSETGVPGIFCYLATIFVTYRMLTRVQKAARHNPAFKDIADLAFCVTVSLTAFIVCGIFSTSAYTFQLPLLAGLTVALDRVSQPVLLGTNAAVPAPSPDTLSIAAPRFRPRPAAPAALA